MDQTTICNLALAKVGDQSITSLTDGSLEARFCNLYYPVVLQELIQFRDWNFAAKLATLTQLSSTPAFGWNYSYQLPNDYCRMLAFNTFGDTDIIAPYDIFGDTLYTDQAYAEISYTSNSPDPSLFTATFVQVFAIKLASELAKPLAGSLDLKNQLKSEFMKSFLNAGQIDGNDARPRKIQPWVNSSLVLSRFTGYLP